MATGELHHAACWVFVLSFCPPVSMMKDAMEPIYTQHVCIFLDQVSDYQLRWQWWGWPRFQSIDFIADIYVSKWLQILFSLCYKSFSYFTHFHTYTLCTLNVLCPVLCIQLQWYTTLTMYSILSHSGMISITSYIVYHAGHNMDSVHMASLAIEFMGFCKWLQQPWKLEPLRVTVWSSR